MSRIRFVGEDDCLNQVCQPVDIDDLKNHKFKYVPLFEDLIKKVKKKGGCGIAAPQIGELVSVIVIKVNGVISDENNTKITLKDNHPLIAINPTFKPTSDQTKTDIEGCLSIPNKFFNIERYVEGVVDFYTINGEKHTYFVKDFVSRVFQHEIDHLNGITLINREIKGE